MAGDEIYVRLSHVSKQLGNFRLETINLEAFKHQIIGVVGENGAGKTTLLQIISQTKKADSGEVVIPSKKKLGFVFDSNHLPEELTAYDLDRIFPHIFEGWESKAFSHYLKRFKLPVDQALKHFSKGMKMKINIAIALSHYPQFLLLDEITSGLDPLARDQILTIIKDYVADHSAIAIMTTHLLDDVVRIADKVVVLRDGSIQLNKHMDEITDAAHLESMLKAVSSEV